MSVLALDIGSSRIKALCATWDGRIIGVKSTATPRRSIAPGERSYPPEVVFSAIESLVTEVTRAYPTEPVDTIVFSCLGTAMAPVDGAGRPLGPALAPADARPQAWLLDEVDLSANELRRLSGSDPAVPSSLWHLLWWQREHPEIVERARRFRSLRGYALQRLCAADVEDRTWASRTMLFDLEADAWSDTVLSAIGLRGELLPPLSGSSATFPIVPAAAERLGLAPVAVAVVGAMDNCSALFGSGGPGRSGLANIVGTYEHMAGASKLAEARAVAAATGAIIHTYLLREHYITMTRVPIGELLTQAFGGSGEPLEQAMAAVSSKPRGLATSLDPSAVSAALNEGVAPADVIQGLLESAAGILVRFARAWADLGRSTEPITVVGGGAPHDAVLELKATLLGRRLVTLARDEAAAVGALRLAAIAVQGASAAEACRLFDNPIGRTISPRTAQPATAPPGVSML